MRSGFVQGDLVIPAPHQLVFGEEQGSDVTLEKSAASTLSIAGSLVYSGGVQTYSGSFSDDVINFSGGTRASGKKFIRMGTYGTPVADNTSTLFGSYGLITSNGSSGILQYHMSRGTGSSDIYGIEVDTENESVGGSNPNTSIAAIFMSGLTNASSKLAAVADHTDGMFAAWFKAWSADGATSAAGSRIASIWLDAQLNGVNHSVTDYFNIYTTGGGKAYLAWADFKEPAGETAGWTNLFRFEAAATVPPIVTAGTAKDVKDNQQAYNIKIEIGGSNYYIPVMAAA